jgi:hypothetical protein
VKICLEGMNSIRKTIILTIALLLLVGSTGRAENYVDWKAGFWFAVPEGWEKVDYGLVDQYLAYMDTSMEVFDYEAVFAPSASDPFNKDAYLVIKFDSTGKLSEREVDSVLNGIANAYATEIFEAPIVSLMSDLIPGKPGINRNRRVVSVLTDMAYRPGVMTKIWQYMQLNDRGIITFFLYSPDSTYGKNKPVFDEIVKSISFDNLHAAAVGEELTFTDIGGENVSPPETEYSGREGDRDGKTDSGRNIPIAVGILIVILVVLRMRKKNPKT